MIMQEQEDKLRRNLEDEKRILNDERAKRLANMLEGKQLLADLHDEKTNKRLLAKGADINRESIEKLRARDLKLEFVYQGQAFKMKPIREIMEKEGVGPEAIAYVGDDVIDLPAMRNVGFAVATANARERVKAEAHYVTPHCGGDGAARDAVEFILEAQGILDKCIDSYIDEDNPIPPSMDIGKGGDDSPSRH